MRRAIWSAVGVAAAASWVVARDGWSGPVDKPAASTPDAAATIELGRRLFFDSAVSRTGRASCASCHDPDHGFTDIAHPSADETGPSRRRSMTVADLPATPICGRSEI
jgi:cytochrome c peroxidase